MDRKEKKSGRKLSGLQRLAGALEVPASSIANVTHMEIEGNSQVKIENSGGVLAYDSNEICIKTGKTMTQFLGRNLEIQCLSVDSLIICGDIREICFSL